MEALVCDICGGKLIIGAGGIAVCNSCGMEHSVDRMKEKVQEIKGTVQIDNSHMVENYLKMAQSAKDVGNHSEAESYCNKIIEIEPTNYKAWMLKGVSAAWQSSLQKSRVDEGVAAFVKAINNAPDEERKDLVEEAKEQIKNLAIAMISLRADRFAKWPDKEEADGFMSDITSILKTVVAFLFQTGDAIPLSEIMTPVANYIDQSVVQAWRNVIWPDYNGDPNDSEDRPRKYEWENFIKRVGYCTSLEEKAISLCDVDDKEDIQRYKNLIFIHQAAIDSCSWTFRFNQWGEKRWYKDWMLTDEAKNSRRNLICNYKEKIKEIKENIEKKEKEEAKKRFDDYWFEHADEKTALETERATLQDKIVSLQNDISSILEDTEKKNIQERIDTLNMEKRSLGLFKVKEKKVVQEKIDAVNLELKKVDDRIDAAKKEIEKKIVPLQQRISEINIELTKAR